MKKNLSEITEGDAIAVHFGYDYIKCRVLGNNGKYITWSSFEWLKSSAVVSSYEEMGLTGWTYLGKESPWWKFWKHIEYEKI